jgi:hypothetical protein
MRSWGRCGGNRILTDYSDACTGTALVFSPGLQLFMPIAQKDARLGRAVLSSRDISLLNPGMKA